MSDELDEIQAIFFEECAEGLTVAEEGLSAMAAGDVSPDIIAAVFRAVHSIKGGSGAFGHAEQTEVLLAARRDSFGQQTRAVVANLQ